MKNEKSDNLAAKVKKLDELLSYFESSGNEFDLDEGIKKYEEAITLVKEVKGSLKAYELKVKELEVKYQEEEAEPESEQEAAAQTKDMDEVPF